jgi:hypothetical protein
MQLGICAVELLEDSLLVRERDPSSLVAYGDEDLLSGGFNANGDPISFAVLGGVVAALGCVRREQSASEHHPGTCTVKKPVTQSDDHAGVAELGRPRETLTGLRRSANCDLEKRRR